VQSRGDETQNEKEKSPAFIKNFFLYKKVHFFDQSTGEIFRNTFFFNRDE
jgi:hypothetical protein